MTLDEEKLCIDRIIKDEGLRLKPYRDSVGKLTIGIGRNLDDVGISEQEARFMLENDIGNVYVALDRQLSWWRKLDGVRQGVLVNMCFNLGINGLLGFKKTLAAIQFGDYESAANGMLQSKWATQVGPRAVRISDMIKTLCLQIYLIQLSYKFLKIKSMSFCSIFYTLTL